jgi:Fe2+ transport system protein FeoA
MTPLTSVGTNKSAIVKKLQGGREFVQRLAAMGILPGTEIKIIKSGGPVIMTIRNNRVVVGRGMGHRILVDPLP